MVSEGMSGGGMAGGGGAMPQEEESVRVRAWVLANAENPAEAAETLMKHPTTDSYVLIRADEVGDGDMNLIVPVVETKRGGLVDALATIRQVTRDMNATAAIVKKHRPPHGSGNDEPNGEHIEGRNPWG